MIIPRAEILNVIRNKSLLQRARTIRSNINSGLRYSYEDFINCTRMLGIDFEKDGVLLAFLLNEYMVPNLVQSYIDGKLETIATIVHDVNRDKRKTGDLETSIRELIQDEAGQQRFINFMIIIGVNLADKEVINGLSHNKKILKLLVYLSGQAWARGIANSIARAL